MRNLLFSPFDITVSRHRFKPMIPSHLSRLPALCLALLFAACMPVKEASTVQPGAGQTRAQAGGNRHAEAARQYLQQAEKASAPLRHQYRLQAAAELLKGGDPGQAQKTLLELPEAELAPGARIRRQLLLAEIALADRRAEAALAHLDALKEVSLEDPQDRRQWHRLRVAGYAASKQPLAEMRERIAQIPYLSEEQERADNLRVVVELSLDQPGQSVEDLLAQARTQGPLTPELAQRIRTLRSMVSQWDRSQTAAPPRIEARPAPASGAPAYPRQIAVLLPLSGRYAQAGAILRDGIMAKSLTIDPRARPVLEFHDTGEDKDQAWKAYERAVAAGAEFVIGPLSKEAVTFFSLAPALPVPVLALNYSLSPLPPPAGFYQFGLSPEDEAVQAAARAWQDGRRRPVILTPDNAWGQRIAESFRQQWLALGGDIAGERAYGAEASDFSPAIREVFELDLSDKRHRRLQQVAGAQLKFSTRRRQDVDFIFIAAQPRQARLLRPQLKFHYAGDLPVYSTSHVFSGNVDPAQDRDLNGIVFCDIPWVANREKPSVYGEINRLWPQNDEQFWRLYALGIDALAVSAALRNAPQELSHPGESGRLDIDANRRIQRELTWAQFKDGAPRPFP